MSNRGGGPVPGDRHGGPLSPKLSDRPAHRKVALLAGVLLVVTAAIGAIGVVSLRSMQRDLEALLMRDGRILTELNAIQELTLRTQLSLEQAASTGGAERDALLQQHQGFFDATVGQWERTSNDAAELGVRTDSAALSAWLDAVSAGRRAIESSTAPVELAESRVTYEALLGSLESNIGPLNERVTDRADAALDRADLANQVMAVAVLLGLVGGAVVASSSYRAVRGQHFQIARNDRQRAAEAARQRIQAQVSQALEFARDDAGALKATELALRELEPDRPTELLLADSSRAHFELGLRSSPKDGLPAAASPHPAPARRSPRGRPCSSPTASTSTRARTCASARPGRCRRSACRCRSAAPPKACCTPSARTAR